MKHHKDQRDEDRWEKVAVVPNEIVAGMLGAALKSSGIPFYEKKTGLDDFPLSPANQRALFVPAERRDEALELLGELWDIEQ